MVPSTATRSNPVILQQLNLQQQKNSHWVQWTFTVSASSADKTSTKKSSDHQVVIPKKKEQQSRYSEISKESRDFSSRALFPAWSYLCVYLCTISVILNVMFSCMRKYLNKNGKPGMGSDPKEKLWNLGVRVNWTKSWIYTDRCVFLETD